MENASDATASGLEGVEWLSLEAAPTQVPGSAYAPRDRTPTNMTIPDASLLSTVHEDGRTYHGYDAGAYHLPNDGDEQDRQDFTHAIYTMLWNDRLHLAPIDSHRPLRVLDVGTGTGIWAIQFAEQHPSSRVVATDLSLTQPQGLLPNCRFVLENSETEDWRINHRFADWDADDSNAEGRAPDYDYIHFRSMAPCFSNFSAMVRKAHDHLAPGGWLEVQDACWDLSSDDGTTEGTALERAVTAIRTSAGALGYDMTKSRYFKDYLTDTGFVDVAEHKIPFPLSPWPRQARYRRIGQFGAAAWPLAMDSYRKIMRKAGMRVEEIDGLAEEAMRDVGRRDIHPYIYVYAVCGRKPLKDEKKPAKAQTSQA